MKFEKVFCDMCGNEISSDIWYIQYDGKYIEPKNNGIEKMASIHICKKCFRNKFSVLLNNAPRNYKGE